MILQGAGGGVKGRETDRGAGEKQPTNQPNQQPDVSGVMEGMGEVT